MFNTVIFDLDGTLLNTLDDLADSANKVCKLRGWPPHPVERYRTFVGDGIPKLVERFAPPYVQDPDMIKEAISQYNEIYFRHMFDKTAPYPGIVSMLGNLRDYGVRMAVFSNKPDELTKAIIARYFDKSLFAAVRGALPGIAKKPAPEGTLALLKQLGVEPAEKKTLYVGDSNVDVWTAHNAGIPCCGVEWGFRGRKELEKEGASYIAEDVAELQNIILNNA